MKFFLFIIETTIKILLIHYTSISIKLSTNTKKVKKIKQFSYLEYICEKFIWECKPFTINSLTLLWG